MNIIVYLLQKYFKEEWFTASALIILGILINVLQTNGVSYVTANIIHFMEEKNKAQVMTFFTIFCILAGLYVIMYYTYNILQNKLLTHLRQWIKQQFINMILLINNEEFTEMNYNKLSSPINRLATVCFSAFTDTFSYILPNMIFISVISAYFFYNDALFGSSFIFANLVIFTYLAWNWSTVLSLNEKYEESVSVSESYLLEILNNIDKIISRGQTQQEMGEFRKKSEHSRKTAYDFYASAKSQSIVVVIATLLIIIFSLFYLILLVFEKKLSVTIFITFFTILIMYRDRMTTLTVQFPDMVEFLGRASSVLELFQGFGDKFIEMDSGKKTTKEVRLPFESIVFDHVNFQYPNATQKPVLNDLNLRLQTTGNRIIGITGLSGNGKSTVAKLIIKLYKPTGGIITIDGENVENLDADYVRSQITYVNQNSKLFDRKIIENMFYGCNQSEQCNVHLREIFEYEKIRELFRNMDIYEKSAGSQGERLSGGQRMIVNVIAGLINPSKILILDEPTNALDSALKTELLQIIRHFKQYKQCILIISHDIQTMSIFDQNIVI